MPDIERRSFWKEFLVKYSVNAILCSFFIFIGFIILTGVGIFGYQTSQFIKTALPAKGKVIKQTAGSSHLAVKFVTNDAKEIEYLQNGFVSRNVGEEVDVLYDPQNPQNASFDTFWALWGGHLMLFLLGFVFILLALFKLCHPNTKWISWNYQTK